MIVHKEDFDRALPCGQGSAELPDQSRRFLPLAVIHNDHREQRLVEAVVSGRRLAGNLLGRQGDGWRAKGDGQRHENPSSGGDEHEEGV
jgi:hypothetical protein